jgi:hypothetical protein
MQSEWQLFRFELTCIQCFGASGSELQYGLAAGNQRTARLLGVGVDSTTAFRIRYSASLFDKSHALTED